MTEFVSLNGRILPEEQATIPAGIAGVIYGAGCFETMRASGGSIFRFRDHMERLNTGLRYLGVPDQQLMQPDILRQEVYQLLKKRNLLERETRVRIQVSLDERNGYQPDEKLSLLRFITANEISLPKPSIALYTVETRVVPDICKPAGFKSGNMLHYRNAYREAWRKSADDGLMRTVDGHIAETSIGNIFWRKGAIIFTPSEECDILPGIMRTAVLQIVSASGKWTVHVGKFTPKELREADLIWVTNSVSEIIPVHELDGKQYRTDEAFMKELRGGLRAMKEAE